VSATGRGAERADLDFYRTPQWCVDAIVPHLPKGGIVLEPGCGDGAILEALLDHGFKLMGVELDPARAAKARCITPAIWEGDYLALDDEPMCHLVIGNPPYSLAEEFVRKSLRMVRPDGVVAMLLRLNWLEGKKRAPFHREHPAEVCILSRRPSFTGGGTDATAYAWFLWGTGRPGTWRLLGTQ
jgi:SAM-dependent methyltransferase